MQFIRFVYRYAQELVAAVEAGDDDARQAAVEALNAEGERHRMFERTHGGWIVSGGRAEPERD